LPNGSALRLSLRRHGAFSHLTAFLDGSHGLEKLVSSTLRAGALQVAVLKKGGYPNEGSWRALHSHVRERLTAGHRNGVTTHEDWTVTLVPMDPRA